VNVSSQSAVSIPPSMFGESSDSHRAHSTLTVGQLTHIWPVKTERWGAGMVICLGRGADLHMAQLMSLPLTVSSFSKIQIGFYLSVPAHQGSP